MERSRRVQPIEAIRGFAALVRDPDNTREVFRVTRALVGKSFDPLVAKVKADPMGREILMKRRPIRPILSDRALLGSMPDGSLGRRYLEFSSEEQISADDLARAAEKVGEREDLEAGSESKVLSQRLRDTHDLWHVVSGYGRDIAGETGLLAFSYAQIGDRGLGFLMFAGMFVLWRKRARHSLRLVDFVRDAHRRGAQAGMLTVADWEALLPLPLDEVRRELGVDPVPGYDVVRSKQRAAA